MGSAQILQANGHPSGFVVEDNKAGAIGLKGVNVVLSFSHPFGASVDNGGTPKPGAKFVNGLPKIAEHRGAITLGQVFFGKRDCNWNLKQFDSLTSTKYFREWMFRVNVPTGRLLQYSESSIHFGIKRLYKSIFIQVVFFC